MAATMSSSSPMQVPAPALGAPSRQILPLQVSPQSWNAAATSTNSFRSGHLNLDSFSPVNQNGSFEFDRVLKSGRLLKRTKKTKAWKSCSLVIRPNLLSIYRDLEEAQLRHQINLSDVTDVACVKDPRKKREGVFVIFSPSRNYHFQASSEKDAHAWVDLIRREARVEDVDKELFLKNPEHSGGDRPGNDAGPRDGLSRSMLEEERLATSSPELLGSREPLSDVPDANNSHILPLSSSYREYSGNELAYSDLSDAPPPRSAAESSTQNHASILSARANSVQTRPISSVKPTNENIDVTQEQERVIWHGYLYCLKSKGGVRQWKKLWVVVRPNKIAFYKNEEEYSARQILPLSSIINAVEIDPLSKNRSHCLQIISEEKSYRFCAPDEEALARCLGALKSVLAKKKEVVR